MTLRARFERVKPAVDRVAIVNPFTRVADREIVARPARTDFIELGDEEGAPVRARGASWASGGAVYPTQRRVVRAIDELAALALEAGFVRVEPRGPAPEPPFTPLDPRGVRAEAFEEALASVPWLVNVGLPSADDESVERLRSFEAWTGPDGVESELLEERSEAWHGYGEVHGAFEVERLATCNVDRPGGDPAFASARSHAAFFADIVLAHLEDEISIPPDLLELWGWFARGHWPCGLATNGELVVL